VLVASAGYGMGRYLVHEPVSGGGFKLYAPHNTTKLRDGSSTVFKTTVSYSISVF
jgi:hypothetical protein